MLLVIFLHFLVGCLRHSRKETKLDEGLEIGLFGEIDAFCYPLEEGLTARRSSVLTCVQSGRPVIVTGPTETDEFDHHPRFKELIDRGAVVLVTRGSNDDAYADQIMSALKSSSVQMPFDFDGWWQDVAEAVRAQFPGDVTP